MTGPIDDPNLKDLVSVCDLKSLQDASDYGEPVRVRTPPADESLDIGKLNSLQ